MTQAILTDLDGVLRIWPPDIQKEAAKEAGLPEGAISKAAFSNDLLFPAITGQTSDEQWRQQVMERLHKDFPDANAEQAVKRWSLSPGELDIEILELLRTCRKKVPIVLITNATSRLSSDLQRLGIQDEFDHIVNSSEEGHMKPSTEIYSTALRTTGVSAKQAFFVDDNADNVTAAVKMGITGHVYAGVNPFRQELNRLGLL